MNEQFQPVSNTPPSGLAGKLKFYGRMLLDLQILTIFRDVKKTLPSLTAFDGKNIPFEDQKFNAVICTEVLEHVHEYQYLVNEIYRTTRPNADIIVTIPWSARYHYIPYDYFRYTPSSLKTIFGQFSQVTIMPRGTDIAVIGSKIIVLFAAGLLPVKKWKYIFVPLYLICLPLLVLAVAIAHLALLFGIGNEEDPLGYTIIIKK